MKEQPMMIMRRNAVSAIAGAVLVIVGTGCQGNPETPPARSADAPTSPAGPKFDAELYAAAEHGNRSGVEYRLNEGADVNAPNPKNGWTPMHVAAYMGHKKLVAFLLTRGGNPNAQDFEGNTPLHLAASRAHNDTTATLIPQTDQTLRNKSGKTAREAADRRVLMYFPKA
jgi:ankyrin repeat protein